MDKEKTYSKAVGSGMLAGMAIAFFLSGIFYTVTQPQDTKTGIGIIILAIVFIIISALFAPPIDDIKVLKGK